VVDQEMVGNQIRINLRDSLKSLKYRDDRGLRQSAV